MSSPPPIRGGIFLLFGWQIRAARVMLRLTVEALAEESGVSSRTIKRIEAHTGIPSSHAQTVLQLHTYFIQKGMTFIPEDGSPEGPGVRWSSYPGRSVAH